MVSVEIYCDRCCLPAPDNKLVEGVGSGQAVRESVPALRRRLYLRAWIYTSTGEDVCPDCIQDSDVVVRSNFAANVRRAKSTAIRNRGEPHA